VVGDFTSSATHQLTCCLVGEKQAESNGSESKRRKHNRRCSSGDRGARGNGSHILRRKFDVTVKQLAEWRVAADELLKSFGEFCKWYFQESNVRFRYEYQEAWKAKRPDLKVPVLLADGDRATQLPTPRSLFRLDSEIRRFIDAEQFQLAIDALEILRENVLEIIEDQKKGKQWLLANVKLAIQAALGILEILLARIEMRLDELTVAESVPNGNADPAETTQTVPSELAGDADNEKSTDALPHLDDLSATAQTIVRTLCRRGMFGPGKDKRLIGRKIAVAAGRGVKFNTQFRTTLHNLKSRGILCNPSHGYYLRTPAKKRYCKKTEMSGQCRSGK